MFQKMIHFIKYHNAFTIGLILVFIFGGVVMASEDVRNAVIGEKIVTESGIDNSQILAADLDNFIFAMTITNVSEDLEYYYVDYRYNTLAIKDNVWQKIVRTGTLTVSKQALAGQDLGLYAAEELGEIIDSQLAYLKEVQEIEMEKGQTFIQQTVKYTALLGLILDPKTHTFPGYVPVVQPPVIEEPLVLCVPNWQCDAWQPSIDTMPLDQGFTQTRACFDLNNCGIDEGKPIEQQTAIGTLLPPAELVPVAPVCGPDHLALCTTEELCEAAGLYWYNNQCNLETETMRY